MLTTKGAHVPGTIDNGGDGGGVGGGDDINAYVFSLQALPSPKKFFSIFCFLLFTSAHCSWLTVWPRASRRLEKCTRVDTISMAAAAAVVMISCSACTVWHRSSSRL